ncbi:MAG: hypothetical protein ACP5SB_00245 [Caldisericaceae bacterium]
MTVGSVTVSFIIDTLFFPELADYYSKSDVLIMNVVRFTPMANLKHLSLEDAKSLITLIKPKVAVLTHFGMTMLSAKPFEQAEKLTQDLGIKTVAATDGMTLKL